MRAAVVRRMVSGPGIPTKAALPARGSTTHSQLQLQRNRFLHYRVRSVHSLSKEPVDGCLRRRGASAPPVACAERCTTSLQDGVALYAAGARGALTVTNRGSFTFGTSRGA